MKLCVLAVGLMLALAPVTAGAQTLTILGGGYIAAGNGATGRKTPDGQFQIGDGKTAKTCRSDQFAVASTLPVSIRTVHDDKTYAQGLVACLDLSDFAGSAVVDTSRGILDIRPAGTK